MPSFTALLQLLLSQATNFSAYPRMQSVLGKSSTGVTTTLAINLWLLAPAVLPFCCSHSSHLQAAATTSSEFGALSSICSCSHSTHEAVLTISRKWETKNSSEIGMLALCTNNLSYTAKWGIGLPVAHVTAKKSAPHSDLDFLHPYKVVTHILPHWSLH